MIDTFLVPEKTTITAKGDGAAVSLDGAVTPILLVSLNISKIVEQEALELSVQGSADSQTWKPVLTFPQKFYCGDTPMLLDLSGQTDVKHLRAHWEVNRWGRGSEAPMFEITVGLREVPKEMLADVKSANQ